MSDVPESGAADSGRDPDEILRHIGVLGSTPSADTAWRAADPAWIRHVTRSVTVRLGLRRPFLGVLEPLAGTRITAFPRLTLPAVRAALGQRAPSDAGAAHQSRGDTRSSPTPETYTRVVDRRSTIETRTVLSDRPDSRMEGEPDGDTGRTGGTGSAAADPNPPDRRYRAGATDASDRSWDGEPALSVLRPTGANLEPPAASVHRMSESAASDSNDERPASEAVRGRPEFDAGSTARDHGRSRDRESTSAFTVLEPPRRAVAGVSRSVRPITDRRPTRRNATADTRDSNGATATPTLNASASVRMRRFQSANADTERFEPRARTTMPAASEPARGSESDRTRNGLSDPTVGSSVGDEALPALTVRRNRVSAAEDGPARDGRGVGDSISDPAGTNRGGPAERNAGTERAMSVTDPDDGAHTGVSARRQRDDAAILEATPTERARFVDSLYRELERKFRVEDERRGR